MLGMAMNVIGDSNFRPHHNMCLTPSHMGTYLTYHMLLPADTSLAFELFNARHLPLRNSNTLWMKESCALNALQRWEAQIAWTKLGARNEVCQVRIVCMG